MPSHSCVWIYLSEREFSSKEEAQIKNLSREFADEWTAHGKLLKVSIEIFHHLFVVICVDEKTAPVSGCGIDELVRFIQKLEKEFSVSLTDRKNVAYRKGKKIFVCKLNELKNKESEIVFNNQIETKEAMEKN